MRNKFEIIYELTMFSLALFSFVVIWSDSSHFIMVDRLVWLLFTIDVTMRLIASKNKLEYIKRNPLDLIAILPFDALFQLARITRLFRVIRLTVIGLRIFKRLSEILKTNDLHRVIFATILLIFLSAIPIHYAETSMETYQDALWWSIVTVTTVGYGDLSPETPLGRVIAVVLMIFGIGLIGMVTGSIATYFMNEKNIKILL